MTKIYSNNKIVIKNSLKQIKGGAIQPIIRGSLEPIQVQFVQLNNTGEPAGAKVFTMYKDVTVNLDNINGYNLYGTIARSRILYSASSSLNN